MNNEKTKEILRKVEHCALRDFYYHDPAHFAEVMLSVPNAVFNIINSRCQESEQSNPYLPEQFVASIIESPDGIRALKLTFSEIKESTFCRSVYAFLSEDNKKPGYYCIEYSSKGMKENPFISEWFPYGKSFTYMIYNSEGLTQENEFLKCAELYRDTDPVSVVKHCEAELQKKEKDDRVEETEGWMECEACGKLHEFTQFRRGKRLPVYRMDAIPMEILHPERMKAGVAVV